MSIALGRLFNRADSGARRALPPQTEDSGGKALFFEPLEPRLLLSADLNPVVSAVVLPTEVYRQDSVVITGSLNNLGDAPAAAAVEVALYASADAQFDAADIKVATQSFAGGLAPGGASPINLTAPLGEQPPGTYRLFVVADAGNALAEQDETNNVALAGSTLVAWSFGNLPGRASPTVLGLFDADGTQITFSLSGPGRGDVVPVAGGYALRLTGTSASTAVNIAASGGDGRVSLREISAASNLGSLLASVADLTGNATFGGSVGSLTLGTLSDAAIQSSGAITTPTLAQWRDTDNVADRLTAPSIGTLNVAGDFAASIHLTGAGPTALTLGTVRITGAVSGGTWYVNGRAGQINAGSTAPSWRASIAGQVSLLATTGNLGGQFAAQALQFLQVGGNLSQATVHIGARLGTDAALGGTGDAADQFGQGTLGRIRIVGGINDSRILVGVDPVDGILFNGNDVIVGGTASAIQQIDIGGPVDSVSRIIAGAYPSAITLGGVSRPASSLPQLRNTVPDVVAPTLSAQLQTDTGISTDDRLTNDPTITGAAADVGGLAALQGRIGRSGDFLPLAGALAADGSFVVSAAQLEALHGAPLADADYIVQLRAQDVAGNASAAAEVAFSLDRTAPASPAIDLLETSDSGANASENVTNDATPRLAITAEAASRITLRLDGSPVGGPLAGPDVEVTLAPLGDGTYTLSANAEDAAGNVSAAGVLQITVDTQAPAAPMFALAPESDTDPTGDDQTTLAVVDLVGQTAPGTQVQLIEAAVTVVADANGVFRFSGVALAIGANTLTARATDLAGNSSQASRTFTRIDGGQDTQPPAIAAGLGDDTGFSNADRITRDPTVIGQVTDAGPIASLRAGFGSDPTGFVSVLDTLQADGTFTLDAARLAAINGGNLPDGDYTLGIQAVDGAGNTSPVRQVVFRLDTAAPAAPSFDLAPSSDSGTAGDQTTSAAVVTLLGTAEEGARLTLAPRSQQALAGAGGVFQFANVALDLGANPLTLTATDAAGNESPEAIQTIVRHSALVFDEVSEWHAETLATIVRDAEVPPGVARTLAIESIAVFDVISAFEGTPAFLVGMTAPAGANMDAAIAGAAHRVLSNLYPAQQAALDARLAASLASIPAGQARTDGLNFGQTLADAILAIRAGDGYKDFVDYPGSTALGSWRPTGPLFDLAALPQWADVAPFVLSSPSALRPDAPPALDSAEYAAGVEEVRLLGSATSALRTADQTESVHFWADGPGTTTPGGHWNEIAAQIAEQQGLSAGAKARLFAQLNVALADAGVAAWDAKYFYGLWRPETAIANAEFDGNDATSPDANWRPRLITPNHPEYISGHSSYSAAAATVLTSVFGEDFAFSAASTGLPGVTRQFTGFEQAAQEAGRSRVFGGIHYEFTNQAGQLLGTQVAQEVLARFSLSEDSQGPSVVMDAVPSAANSNLTVTGQVLDNLSGVASLQVEIDPAGESAGENAPPPQGLPVVFDAAGHFSFSTSFATDGTDDGPHELAFTALDAAGNASVPVLLRFTLDTRAPAITVSSLTDGGTLAADARATGIADPTGAAITALTYAFDGTQAVPLIFDVATGAFDQALDLSRLAAGPHSLTLIARDAAGNEATSTLQLNLPQAVPLTVTRVTPAPGSDDVGATYRPQVFFSRAVDLASLTADTFFATDTTGARLAANIVVGDGGRFAWLFFNDPMPGSSTITVHLKATEIRAAADGQLLDADGDGTPEADFVYRFTTVSLASVPGTILRGKVVDPGADFEPMTFDDFRRGPDGIPHTPDDVFLNPIAHAEVTILGRPDLHTFTDANGDFELTDVPAGNVKVVINGRAATNAPAGFYFPEMTLDVTLEPGLPNTIMGSMGTREEMAANEERTEVYLPRLREAILQTVDNSQPVSIGLDPESTTDLTPEQVSQLRLQFEPGSLVGEDGQALDTAQIGISTVPPELVRDMLPPGVLQHTFDITIQAPGVAAFSTPLQITFPNVFNAPAGTTLNFLSFDHTTGRLVIEGTATVSQDGKSVTPDSGSGITKPGWHGATPQGGQNGPKGKPPQPPAPPPPPGPPPRFNPPGVCPIITGTPPTGGAGGGGGGGGGRISIPAPSPPPAAAPGAGTFPVFKKVEVYIDGHGQLEEFMRAVPGGIPIDKDYYSYLLFPPSAPKPLELVPLTYEEMFGSGGLVNVGTNHLYGSKITIEETEGASDGTITKTITPYYIYRLVDAADDSDTDATIAFEDTLIDGQGAQTVHRGKQVAISTGSQSRPTFAINGGANACNVYVLGGR